MNTLRGITGRDLAYDDEEHLLSIGDTIKIWDRRIILSHALILNKNPHFWMTTAIKINLREA